MAEPPKTVLVTDKIRELGGDPRDEAWEPLRKLARLTALRQGADGSFFVPNWRRGPLLYSLVRHRRPARILEFGTGRGYGALAMAQAAVDAGVNATVWTIDVRPPDEPLQYAIDEGRGPEMRSLSVREVWERHVPAPLRERVRCLTGGSRSVMRGWKRQGLPSVDFVFIDAGHDYGAVKDDFCSALGIAQAGTFFLFDDYGDRPGFGVKRLVDEEIAPRCPPALLEIVDTLAGAALPAPYRDIDHRMAALDLAEIADPLRHFYSRAHVLAHRTRRAGQALAALLKRGLRGPSGRTPAGTRGKD